MMAHKSLILALFVLGLTGAARASSLLDVYHLALEHDAQYRGAIAANRAAQEAVPQARAGLLPNVTLGADTFGNRQDGPLVDGTDHFNTHGYTLSLTQPVFRWDRWVALGEAGNQVKQANAELDFALQDLILRAAQRYFDLLKAHNNLDFTVQTKKAFARQLTQAQQRFEVGLIAITGVEEAKAAYDLAVADQIAAENEVDNAREALRELIAEYPSTLQTLGEEMPLVSPDPQDIDQWTATALEQNLQLSAARYAAQAASDEIRRRRAGHYPTLDLVASRDQSASNQNRGGFVGSGSTRTESIGLQFNLPIYAGGATVSSTREAAHLYQQALDAVEQARRSTQRQTRDAYRGVLSGISRVKALKQSLTSTQTALKAIEAGFLAGTRTTVDVLNAQRDTYRALRDYKDARYDYILSTLALKQAAGTLSDAELHQVNAWLEP